ncbi:BTAD domain-containing putative transcriptional regulator [Saccharothrix sp. HUAS TT1]|uniref:BTAD domain-containing putative transcriptional regulator n=1 Tax=unclassified Saccharothrix TaxID=2593673 RepID=UPI00345BD8B0
MRLEILGPMRLVRDGGVVALGGPRQRDLLALLVLRNNRVVTADWLVEALWDGRPPAGAHTTLRSYVAGLRRALEPSRGRRAPADVLRGHTGGYELSVPPEAVDAVRFTALAESGARALDAGNSDAAERHYADALALWRGEVAGGELTAVRPDAARLAEARSAAAEGFFTAAVAAGRHLAVLPDLRQFVAANPGRENARAQLMLALYRAGRQAEALAGYDEGRRVLAEEFGVRPGRLLRDLHRAVLAHEVPPVATGRTPGTGTASATGTTPTATATTPDTAATAPTTAATAPAATGTASTATAPAAASTGTGTAPIAAAHHLVGRAAELAALVDLLTASSRAGGRVVAIVGEPGIGKTSLADAVARQAATEGVPVTWGRCPDIGQTPPFWLWVQVVRALAPLARDAGADPALTIFGPGQPTGADIDPAARFRAYDAVATLVREAAAPSGLVLVLDDLHAADADSLLLLRYLAATVHTSRALVVATLRPYEHDPDLVAALADLARVPGHRQLRPTGLDADAVADLVRERTGTRPPADVARDLVTRTGGNPFFLTELLASPDGAPPPSVRDTVRLRLHALDRPTRDWLDVLSVAGRELDVDLLGGVTSAGVRLTHPVTHLVTEAGPGVVRFRHPLFAEAAYADLTPTRRADLHARLADAGAHALTPAELAHHYGQARGREDDHLRWTLEAADDATRRLAYEDALAHLDRAAALLTATPDRELAVQLHRTSLLQITVGVGSDAVDRAGSRARELLARVDPGADVRTAVWTLGELACNRAEFAIADDLAGRLAQDGGVIGVAGRYLLGAAAYFTGRLADAEDHLTAAVDRLGRLDPRRLADQTGRTPTLAAHNFRALVRSLRGDTEAARVDIATAHALAERSDDPYGRANAALFAGWAALQEHDAAAALDAGRRCREIGARQHMPHFLTTGDFFTEWAAVRGGDDGRLTALRTAADGIYRPGLRATRTITLAATADAHLVVGDRATAAELADQGLAVAGQVGEHVLTAELLRVRGLARADRSDLDAGADLAREQGAELLLARFPRWFHRTPTALR